MRKSAAKRRYDQKWRRIRGKYLQANPFCVCCAQSGYRQLAQHVDHIIPHEGDPALFWNRANWQSLCFHHHWKKRQGL